MAAQRHLQLFSLISYKTGAPTLRCASEAIYDENIAARGDLRQDILRNKKKRMQSSLPKGCLKTHVCANSNRDSFSTEKTRKTNEFHGGAAQCAQ